jgi:hypothetical protein
VRVVWGAVHLVDSGTWVRGRERGGRSSLPLGVAELSRFGHRYSIRYKPRIM